MLPANYATGGVATLVGKQRSVGRPGIHYPHIVEYGAVDSCLAAEQRLRELGVVHGDGCLVVACRVHSVE
jgi:hypothetical protein